MDEASSVSPCAGFGPFKTNALRLSLKWSKVSENPMKHHAEGTRLPCKIQSWHLRAEWAVMLLWWKKEPAEGPWRTSFLKLLALMVCCSQETPQSWAYRKISEKKAIIVVIIKQSFVEKGSADGQMISEKIKHARKYRSICDRSQRKSHPQTAEQWDLG